MPTFDYMPAPNMAKAIKPNVSVAVFGDGYEQRIPNGINTQKRSFSLAFNRITEEIDLIEAFLIERNGVESFDWTPPNSSAGKFVCRQWNRTDIYLNVGSLTATFEEVFE